MTEEELACDVQRVGEEECLYVDGASLTVQGAISRFSRRAKDLAGRALCAHYQIDELGGVGFKSGDRIERRRVGPREERSGERSMLRHGNCSKKNQSDQRIATVIVASTHKLPVHAVPYENASRAEQPFCTFHEFGSFGETVKRTREYLVYMVRIARDHLVSYGFGHHDL